jgi:RNA polymerase sigma-70 factor (ECF subfamily)
VRPAPSTQRHDTLATRRENLPKAPLVGMGDMGTLHAMPDLAGAAAPTALDARRERFLVAARPELDRLYRLAGLILGDAHEAEDAVGDAVSAAWQRFDDLRDADRFAPWIDRIVVNRCRDRLRRRSTVRFVPLAADVDPPERDPFLTFLERDALLAHLRDLTDDERIVVVLRYWADLPLDAIADRLEVPLGTVKSRLHRALGRLRTALVAENRSSNTEGER